MDSELVAVKFIERGQKVGANIAVLQGAALHEMSALLGRAVA